MPIDKRKELEHYRPPLTKEQKALLRKCKITEEVVKHYRTNKNRENRDELR